MFCEYLFDLSLLIILGYFNRFAADDYCSLKALDDYGYWGSLLFWYNSWQGRLGPHLIVNLIIKLHMIRNSSYLSIGLHKLIYFFLIKDIKVFYTKR